MTEQQRSNIFGNGINRPISPDSSRPSPDPRPESNLGGKFVYDPEINNYKFVKDKKS